MKSRIEDVPKLRTIRTQIEGGRFNQVKLGLLRLGSPIRLALAGLRGMDVVVEDKAWVCVDRTLYDLPVLAWTDFETAERRAIHEPVPCRLHYYHVHADLIAETVLSTLLSALAERLQEKFPLADATVSPLRRRKP